MSDNIRHNGIIDRIEGGIIYVRITQQSACAGCHAKSMCSASDSKEKIIEVVDRSNAYSPSEEVVLIGRSALGLQAVFFAFVIPLILVVAALFAGTSLEWPETTTALIALIVLVPYYGLLYLLREKLKRKFIFTLEKRTDNLS